MQTRLLVNQNQKLKLNTQILNHGSTFHVSGHGSFIIKREKMYNRYKSDYYKNMLKAVSTNYKKMLSSQQKRFKDNKISKLKSNWNIINSAKKSDNVSASFKYFYTFSKMLILQTVPIGHKVMTQVNHQISISHLTLRTVIN